MASSWQDNYIRTALRLPPDVHAAVHEHARRHERSFNSQIVAVLRDKLVEKSEEVKAAQQQ